jgi:hypothetical protein
VYLDGAGVLVTALVDEPSSSDVLYLLAGGADNGIGLWLLQPGMVLGTIQVTPC